MYTIPWFEENIQANIELHAYWQTDANYWSCWILACCYDLVSQTVE